jgi:hypothetical protein
MITLAQAAQEAIESLENMATKEYQQAKLANGRQQIKLHDSADYHQGVANELRKAMLDQTKTIAALNQRIDFLNTKWNQHEPQYSTKPI